MLTIYGIGSRSEIAGSKGSVSVIYYHQQRAKLLASPQCHRTAFRCFWIFAHLIHEKWYLSIVLVYISLFFWIEVKHPFHMLTSKWAFSENCFRFYFFYRDFVFLSQIWRTFHILILWCKVVNILSQIIILLFWLFRVIAFFLCVICFLLKWQK